MFAIFLLFLSIISFASQVPEWDLQKEFALYKSRHYNFEDPNEHNTIKKYQLQLACANHRLDVVKYLLEHHEDINRHGFYGCHLYSTPLIIAIEAGDVEIVKYLLEHKANVNLGIGPARWAPLDSACMYHNSEILKLLIRYGAHINGLAMSSLNDTPIHIAFSFFNVAAVKILLSHKPIFNENIKLFKPLINYKDSRLASIARQLLLYGKSIIDLTKYKEYIFPEVHYGAVIYEHIYNILDHLKIKNQRCFNAEDKDGNTPLFYAATQRNVSMVHELLKHGSAVFYRNHDHRNVLEYVNHILARIDLESDMRQKYVKIMHHLCRCALYRKQACNALVQLPREIREHIKTFC